jgi:hypothetical protein
VTEPPHDQLEQRADVVVGLADENPGHAQTIAAGRRDFALRMV